MRDEFVTQKEFKPVQLIAFGLVAAIGLAFIAGLASLVIIQ